MTDRIIELTKTSIEHSKSVIRTRRKNVNKSDGKNVRTKVHLSQIFLFYETNSFSFFHFDVFALNGSLSRNLPLTRVQQRGFLFRSFYVLFDPSYWRKNLCCSWDSNPAERFFKNGLIPASFVYFRSFLITISIQIEKSVDGVLGIQTRGRRMVGADKTTELWRPQPRWKLPL